MNEDRTVLTDAIWARIEHVSPGKETDPGVTAADSRQFLEAVLWRTRTGSPWRGLPERFSNWNSTFKRFRRWALSGIFENIFNELSDAFDLEYVFVDGTIVQARQKAAGAKGGLPAGYRPPKRRPDQQDRGSGGRAWKPRPLRDPSRTGA